MEILEQFIQGKLPDQEKCEDGIFVNEHYVAVVDGASTKSKQRFDGKTTGKMATELILSRLATLRVDVTAEECTFALNGAIAEWYQANERYEEAHIHPIERCAAVCVIYSAHRRQLWFVDDCQALVDGVSYTHDKLVDVVHNNARSLFILSALRQGKTIEEFLEHDSGRDYVLPLIEGQNYFQNVKGDTGFEYQALDGFFDCSGGVKTVDIVPGAHEIVLASDGYPRLFPSLEQSEKALREILTEDPLLIVRHKSTKGLQKGNNSFDDRAYIRFRTS